MICEDACLLTNGYERFNTYDLHVQTSRQSIFNLLIFESGEDFVDGIILAQVVEKFEAESIASAGDDTPDFANNFILNYSVLIQNLNTPAGECDCF